MRISTAVLLACAVSAITLEAQTNGTFVNGQAARAEFGQYTFTYGGATPGTTAPVESVTCPEMVPVDPCARRLAGNNTTIKSEKKQHPKKAPRGRGNLRLLRAVPVLGSEFFLVGELVMRDGAKGQFASASL